METDKQEGEGEEKERERGGGIERNKAYTDRPSTEEDLELQARPRLIAREFTYRASKARKKMWSGNVVVEINGIRGFVRALESRGCAVLPRTR